MEGAKLRFPGPDRADHPLAIGVHGVVRHGADALEIINGADAQVRLCVDRRGVWLTVDGDDCGVHVNGRPIRRMAMLRVGDAIYIDGIELRLVGAQAPQLPPSSLETHAGSTDAIDPRIVLRGVGGRYHGRSFTLERPRLVGRHAGADIRIDDPAFADRHARLELEGQQVILRDLGSAEGSIVNGEAMRDAILKPGDQVVFDAHHRFVVEAPKRSLSALPDGNADTIVIPDMPSVQVVSKPTWRLPWLLLAALLLAALLAVLLLFGQA